MADTIRPFVGERVLEIGAGIGNLTRALLPRRKHHVATDIDSEHLARLATRFQHRPNLLSGTAIWRGRRTSELKAKMEEAGFRVERILDFNRISRPPWFVSGRILKRTTPGTGQMKVFDRFVWLWRILDSYLPWPPTSIIAIGVKPE